MKKSLSTVFVLMICLICCGLLGCGTEDDETPNINTLEGFWKFHSFKGCDGGIEYPDDENWAFYLKITDGLAYTYVCDGIDCYSCPDENTEWTNGISSGEFIVNNNIMEQSFYEDDDDNIATPDCLVTNYFERSDESIVDEAVEDCNTYDQLD